LLPQGEDLQGGVIPTAEENSDSARRARMNWSMNSSL
jgi:hypothetical protein